MRVVAADYLMLGGSRAAVKIEREDEPFNANKILRYAEKYGVSHPRDPDDQSLVIPIVWPDGTEVAHTEASLRQTACFMNAIAEGGYAYERPL